jgi:hypothetical protein
MVTSMRCPRWPLAEEIDHRADNIARRVNPVPTRNRW